MAESARHHARRGAVQFLFSQDIEIDDTSSDEQYLLVDPQVISKGDIAHFQKLISNIPQHLTQIDEIIARVSNRDVARIDHIVRTILRLGVYELVWEAHIPPKVVINECINLAREFGGEKSYRFINAVLDRLEFSGELLAERRKSGRGRAASRGGMDGVGREFELIKTYFKRSHPDRADVLLGVGDDAAVVELKSSGKLVVSTDAFVEGIHFMENTDPGAIGYKSLAVSLSDIAAMGASPRYATLSLSVPEVDAKWLQKFSEGFFALAADHQVVLIGGDTIRGPMAAVTTVFGELAADRWIARGGASVGDGIYVTGTLGDAALGLMCKRETLSVNSRHKKYFEKRLERPEPRVAVGRKLAEIASSAIDISDGLLADLRHLLVAGSVGARIELDEIPLSDPYQKIFEKVGWDHALSFGDDYELCFTMHDPADELRSALESETRVRISKIGTVTEEREMEIYDPSGDRYTPMFSGYTHF